MDILQGYKEETAFLDVGTPSDCLKKDLSPIFHNFYPQPWLDQTLKNFRCQESSQEGAAGTDTRRKLVEQFEGLKGHSLQVFMVHTGAVQIKRAELTEFFVFYGNMHGVNVNPVGV